MYSVIEIGSNTIRFIAYQAKDNKLEAMLNKKFGVGLAGYMEHRGDANQNYLSEEGIDKLINILLEFEYVLDFITLKEVFPFATASLRNIQNSAEVLEMIKQKTKFEIELLSGEQEALYEYNGMKQNLDTGTGIMIDIGGGSTEIVFFKDDKTILAYSLPIGSLHMYTNFVDDILPTHEEIIRMQSEVKRHLNLINVQSNISNINNINNDPSNYISLNDFNTICSVGGTGRAAAKIVNRKKKQKYRQEPYPANELTKLVAKASCNKQINNNNNNIKIASIDNSDNNNNINITKKLTDQILKVCPERVHSFIPGLIILETIASEYNVETIVTSQYGVREGYLYSKLEQRGVFNE